MTPTEMINKIRSSANLDNNNDFSKSIAVKLKSGKIGFQLIAPSEDNMFRARTQHIIPTVPNEDDKNEKWIIADCKGEGCPVCMAVNAFKQTDISVDDINSAYMPKYPYKNIKSVFTQPEHFLLFAKITTDQADNGDYLPKNAELGSTHLIQFPRTALSGLIDAYADYKETNDDSDEDTPPLVAIFDKNSDTAQSLSIICRVTNQPYSVNFTFGKVKEIKRSEIDEDKMKLLIEAPEVPAEHYEKCVKRIEKIKNYFLKIPTASVNTVTDMDDSDLPFSLGDTPSVKEESTKDSEDDFNIDDLL